MALQAKYPFLDILSESEAVARGVNLSDKITHTIYKTLRNLSTPDSASRGMLLNASIIIPELGGMSKQELTGVLKKLVFERAVAHFFRLEYNANQNRVVPISCFAVIPSVEKGSIDQVYHETIHLSVKAVESLLDNLPSISRTEVWQDFEVDLKSQKIPTFQDIPMTLISLFGDVQASRFDLVPPREMIQAVTYDILTELSYRGKLVEIPDYGIMPLKEREYLLRLDTAGDFIKTKLIPKYRKKGNLSRELEQIALEEAYFHLDEFADEASTFNMKRASALKKAILADRPAHASGGVRFPGSLPVEIVLALEPKSSSFYKDKKIRQIAQETLEIRNAIYEVTESWSDNIHVFTESEFERIHPEVRERLLADTELMNCEWELPDQTVYIFIKKDVDLIRYLVEGMIEPRVQDYWKILVLRNLIDRYEVYFHNLFADPHFVQKYGKILRQAYLSYMPFLHRILLFFRITLFQNQAFAIAKKGVILEQQIRSQANRGRHAEQKLKDEEEQKARIGRIRSMESLFSIIEALDGFYMENRVPTVSEVREVVRNIDPAGFREIIKKEGFQTVSSGKAAGEDEAILIYPVDHEWRSRSVKLTAQLESMKLDLESRTLNDLERIHLERANRLLQYLKKSRASVLGTGKKGGSQEDPYQRLDREIRKMKQEESVDDLEV
jgi:hypothetical protein